VQLLQEYLAVSMQVQAYLEDIDGSVSDHGNKVNIAIK